MKLRKTGPFWASVLSSTQWKQWHPQRKKSYFSLPASLPACPLRFPQHSWGKFLIKWHKDWSINYAPLTSRRIQCALSSHTPRSGPCLKQSQLHFPPLSLFHLGWEDAQSWIQAPGRGGDQHLFLRSPKWVLAQLRMRWRFSFLFCHCCHRVQSWICKGRRVAL